MSAHGHFAGVGVQQIPGERAGALTVGEHAVGCGVLHLQPHLVSHGEVEHNSLAGGGMVGCFCCFDYRVEVAEQTDLKRLEGDRQVEGEDVGAVDGGGVDAPDRVEVPLPVGKDVCERNRKVLYRKRLVETCRECRLDGRGAGSWWPHDTHAAVVAFWPKGPLYTLDTNVTFVTFSPFFSWFPISAVRPICALTHPLLTLITLLAIQPGIAGVTQVTLIAIKTFGSHRSLDPRQAPGSSWSRGPLLARWTLNTFAGGRAYAGFSLGAL